MFPPSPAPRFCTTIELVPTAIDVALTLLAAVTFDRYPPSPTKNADVLMLPTAVINPPVTIFPPVTSPVAVRVPLVTKFDPVKFPVALIVPDAVMLIELTLLEVTSTQPV